MEIVSKKKKIVEEAREQTVMKNKLNTDDYTLTTLLARNKSLLLVSLNLTHSNLSRQYLWIS